MKHIFLISVFGLGTIAALGLGYNSHSKAQTGPTDTVQAAEKLVQSETLAHPKYVVELFTSQGCSSCPKANRFVSELAKNRTDTLVLSYGVTYWDYLGWKDSFGDPAFTARQREYGSFLGSNNYTPQMVLNGAAHSPHYTESDVISMPLARSRPLSTISRDGSDKIVVSADLSAEYSLSLIKYKPGSQKVAVKAGENSGRTLTIENVVLDIQTPDWEGEALHLPSSLAPGEAYAALFHAPNSSKIVTAAILNP